MNALTHTTPAVEQTAEKSASDRLWHGEYANATEALELCERQCWERARQLREEGLSDLAEDFTKRAVFYQNLREKHRRALRIAEQQLFDSIAQSSDPDHAELGWMMAQGRWDRLAY